LTVQPVPAASLEGLFAHAKAEPQRTPEPAPKAPASAAKAPAPAAPAPIPQAPAKKKELEPVNALGDFVADLERSLGDDFLPPAAAEAPVAIASAQPWPTSAPAAPKPEAPPAPAKTAVSATSA